MVSSVCPELAFSHVTPGTRLVAFNDRPLKATLTWNEVGPVVEGSALPWAFTFAVLKPFVTRKRCGHPSPRSAAAAFPLPVACCCPHVP